MRPCQRISLIETIMWYEDGLGGGERSCTSGGTSGIGAGPFGNVHTALSGRFAPDAATKQIQRNCRLFVPLHSRPLNSIIESITRGMRFLSEVIKIQRGNRDL